MEGGILTIVLHALDVRSESCVDTLRCVGLVQSLRHHTRTSYERRVIDTGSSACETKIFGLAITTLGSWMRQRVYTKGNKLRLEILVFKYQVLKSFPLPSWSTGK